MKRNVINKPRLIYFFVSILLHWGCTDSNTDDYTEIQNNQNVTKEEYHFTSPQLVFTPNFSYEAGSPPIFISENGIFQRDGNVRSMNLIKLGTNLTWRFEFPEEPKALYRTEFIIGQGPFALNKSAEFLYVITGQSLYRCNMKSGDVTSIAKLKDIGQCSFMKYTTDDMLFFSTDLNNGSILSLSNGSDKYKTVVSNLGSVPSCFDFSKGQLYFLIKSGLTWQVKKVNSTGEVSTVMSSTIRLSKLMLDKHENIILQSDTTIDGFNYLKYSIYDISGKTIANIKDNFGYLILSGQGSANAIPSFVDQSNNFYFGHTDFISNSSINHCNPFHDGKQYNTFIYKIQLIKRDTNN